MRQALDASVQSIEKKQNHIGIGKDSKPRKLFTKDKKYREPKKIDFD